MLVINIFSGEEVCDCDEKLCLSILSLIAIIVAKLNQVKARVP